MQKRALTIALCLVMVSAFAATNAVSAANTDNTAIRQYDIVWNYDTNQIIGKLTLNVETGHWVTTINFAKSDDNTYNKEWAKENSPYRADPENHYNGWYQALYLKNDKAPTTLDIIPATHFAEDNAFGPGGTQSDAGYLDMSNSAVVNWLAQYADGATAIAW